MMNNIAGAMQPKTGEDAPWYMKNLARVVGAAAGVIAIGLGFFTLISLSAQCMLMGLWQMGAGFIVVSFEAPCCCMFVEIVQKFSEFAEKRTAFQKAIGYFGLSAPPILFCFSVSTLFGSGLIFATAVLYGMQALGSKAPKEEMMMRASGSQGFGDQTLPTANYDVEANKMPRPT